MKRAVRRAVQVHGRTWRAAAVPVACLLAGGTTAVAHPASPDAAVGSRAVCAATAQSLVYQHLRNIGNGARRAIAAVASALIIVAAAAASGPAAAVALAGRIPPGLRGLPGLSSSEGGSLYGVAAVSASDVWTVGYQTTVAGDSKDSVEHWDGSTWQQEAVPSPGSVKWPYAGLTSVAAVSADDVWAAGTADTPNNGYSFTSYMEHWNGTAWKQTMLSPKCSWNGQPWDGLNSIAVLSANNVWAAGFCYWSSLSGGTSTLVEHWNGSTWTQLATPNPSSVEDYFYGVTAVSANDVWAFGFQGDPGSCTPLVEHWNGTKWSVVQTPRLPTAAVTGLLTSGSVVSANNIYAVGHWNNARRGVSLVDNWNGTKWSTVASQSLTGSNAPVLSGVSAVSAKDIWAAGYVIGGNNNVLADHYNGHTWALTQVAGLSGTKVPYLYGVVAVTASDAWAVGEWVHSRSSGPLVEHFNGKQWTAVSP